MPMRLTWWLVEVEINPLAVLPGGSGVSAVDCLIVPRGRER